MTTVIGSRSGSTSQCVPEPPRSLPAPPESVIRPYRWMMIGYWYSRISTSPLVSAPKQHCGPTAGQPSVLWDAPPPLMIVARIMDT